MEASVNLRELALDMLLELERGQEYENLLIRNVLDKYNYLEGSQKAFLKRLTEGVTERRIQLDYALECFSSVPVRKMKPLIRCLLRMGAYQILFMDGVPDSAACNEAVKLAAKRHFQSLKGFVNGVLRSLSRKKQEIPWPDREKEPLRFLSVMYSMPEWLVELWREEYGQEKTERILQGLLEKRPVTIRLARRLTAAEREQVLSRLEQAGAGPKHHPFFEKDGEQSALSAVSPYAYTLEKSEGVASLPGFAEGAFAVQDVSSMLVAECAGLGSLRPGAFLLDVCAAPGGKAIHAAECLDGSGSVQARDVSEYKAAYIRENAERMHISNLEVRVWDATVRDEAMKEQADIVLADLPCSGLGVIGRKADIKYRVTPESLKEVAALQRRILETVREYVKPGGILVYSTCTINRAENEENAEWFCENFPFEPVDLSEKLPAGCVGQNGFLQLLPGIHDTDGFFISVFRKNSRPEE